MTDVLVINQQLNELQELVRQLLVAVDGFPQAIVPPDAEWLSFEQVARLLQVNASTVRRLARQGLLTARNISRSRLRATWRIERQSLRQFILDAPEMGTPAPSTYMSRHFGEI